MRFRKVRDPRSIATHWTPTPAGITDDMRDTVGRAIAVAPTLAELARRLAAEAVR